MAQPEAPRRLDDPLDDFDEVDLRFREQKVVSVDRTLPTTPTIPPPPPLKGEASN